MIKKTFRKKMKEDSGASLMLALLFFVICAMVASVVLASATAAVGRITSIKEADQVKYSLTSASRLIKDNISGWSYEWASNEETTGADSGGATPTPAASPFTHKTDTDTKKKTNYLIRVLQDMAEACRKYRALAAGSASETAAMTVEKQKMKTTLTLSAGDSAAALRDTTAVLEMKEDYSIECVISVAPKDKDKAETWPTMVIRVPADSREWTGTQLGTSIKKEDASSEVTDASRYYVDRVRVTWQDATTVMAGSSYGSVSTTPTAAAATDP